MSRTVCRLLALGLLWLGVIGFADPNLARLHLTPVHNVTHLFTGFLAFCVGFGGSTRSVRALGSVLGVGYTALGVLGVVAPSLLGEFLAHAPGLDAAALLPDNLLNVCVGSLFLVVGLFQSRPAADMRRGYL
jgi:hypothetical protein